MNRQWTLDRSSSLAEHHPDRFEVMLHPLWPTPSGSTERRVVRGWLERYPEVGVDIHVASSDGLMTVPFRVEHSENARRPVSPAISMAAHDPVIWSINAGPGCTG